MSSPLSPPCARTFRFPAVRVRVLLLDLPRSLRHLLTCLNQPASAECCDSGPATGSFLAWPTLERHAGGQPPPRPLLRHLAQLIGRLWTMHATAPMRRPPPLGAPVPGPVRHPHAVHHSRAPRPHVVLARMCVPLPPPRLLRPHDLAVKSCHRNSQRPYRSRPLLRPCCVHYRLATSADRRLERHSRVPCPDD